MPSVPSGGYRWGRAKGLICISSHINVRSSTLLVRYRGPGKSCLRIFLNLSICIPVVSAQVARYGKVSHPSCCTATMTSTVVFPANDVTDSKSAVSALSRHATALEICDMVYGNSTPSWEAIEHYYEPGAGEKVIYIHC